MEALLPEIEAALFLQPHYLESSWTESVDGWPSENKGRKLVSKRSPTSIHRGLRRETYSLEISLRQSVVDE